jgi:rod shape-determining protein MreD
VKPALWHRLDAASRDVSPVGLTIVLLIVGLVPLQLPGLAQMAPQLPLMAVYHWSVYVPRLMPAWGVFAIGALQDLLTGGPLGVQALVLLAVLGVVRQQHRFFAGKSFAVLWLGFALIAAGAMALAWFFVSILSLTVVGPRPAAFQYLLTVGLYPLVAWLLLRWQQAFLKGA